MLPYDILTSGSIHLMEWYSILHHSFPDGRTISSTYCRLSHYPHTTDPAIVTLETSLLKIFPPTTQISWNVPLLSLKIWWSYHCLFLHMWWQQSSHDVGKNMQLLDILWFNYNKTLFLSNWIVVERSLVKWVPVASKPALWGIAFSCD